MITDKILMKIFHIVILILIGLGMPGFSLLIHANQFNDYPSIIGVEQISHDQGLIPDLITEIHQDKTGYMWFVSERGLIKYDGYDFTVYKNDPHNPNSLMNDIVRTMLEDSDGSFWIATNKGLDHFNQITNKFTHYSHQPSNPKSLSDDSIADVYKDKSGNLWIATYRGGLNLYDPKTDSFTIFKHDPSNLNSFKTNRLHKIIEDEAGRLWISTLENNGLECFHPDTRQVEHYDDMPKNPYIPDIMHLSLGKQGQIWYGTWDQGLYSLDPPTRKIQKFQK